MAGLYNSELIFLQSVISVKLSLLKTGRESLIRNLFAIAPKLRPADLIHPESSHFQNIRNEPN